MAKSIAFLLLLALVAVNAASVKVKGNAHRAKVAPKIKGSALCDSAQIANLEKCCDLPKLLRYGVVQNCIAAVKNNDDIDGTACVVECVFRNQSMITSAEVIDIKATTAVFIAPVNNVWQPLVVNAVNKCEQELNKAMPVNSALLAKGCNPRPALLMSCVGRYLALTCPSSSVKPGNDCAEKLTHLKECNPFKLVEVPGLGVKGGTTPTPASG